MSQPTPFTSDTSNWYGTMTSTISGSGAGTVGGGYKWDINFVINQDNSIQGTATGKGSLEVQTSQAMATATPSGQLKVTGNYDPGSKNINLVFNLVDIAGAIDATSPTGSASGEMTWVPAALQLITPNMDAVISPILKNDVTTITGQDGQSQTFTEPAGLTQADNTWSAPPVPKQDGGTVTKTLTYPGITVTSVLTIYQSIAIQRLDSDDSTFITTDTPEFSVNVKVPGYDPNSASWSVNADSQYAGAPNPSGAASGSSFSFTPSSNNPTTGSVNPNSPLQYKLQVMVGNLMATSEVTQDEIDTLRQEYVDYHRQATSRDDFFPCAAAPTGSYNNGNYGYMLDPPPGMEAVFQAIAANVNAGITIEGGFRCPQRNMAKGGVATSIHCLGRALDLAPNPFVPGGPATIANMVSIYQAAVNLGYHAICEAPPQGNQQVILQPDNHAVNHVHVEW